MSRLELTPWDLQFLLLDPIQKGILFHKPQSQELQNSLIHHLKTALARTLDFFPPLAGRLGTVVNNDDNTQSFFIDCNNAGAEFTHALAADLSVSDIHEAKYIPEIVSSLFPLTLPNYEGLSRPLLGVQVTELADGYFISCMGNHVVMDGISFWHFFNSCVFHFSKENVAKLKAKANSEAGTDKISSLQALTAHLWRSIHNNNNNNNNNNIIISSQKASIYLLVGARPRIPLPEEYFGSPVYVGATEMNETELLKNGIGHAAMKINELVAQQTGKTARKYVEDWVKKPEIINVYGNDFGWGKPIAVRSGKGQKSDGKMTLFPAAEAGGIDVEACLAPETLRALEDDVEFMEACTP
ncbi:uncharacterized acetyltransferase at3g50280 [Phtheirospermum japonicum]|uniref:Uncharacterized acetyltransferase at3g50280 n=1 Tax=Phtheirospermum japonicum TaxID=374723 RepID=A0A830BV76_9LAMI|nr:uncharacterized acetyltransferase at3g50280 [Phtheirospermum japonicum]